MAIKFSQCYQIATENYDDQKTDGDQKALDCHTVVVTKNLSIATILLPSPHFCSRLHFPPLVATKTLSVTILCDLLKKTRGVS